MPLLQDDYLPKLLYRNGNLNTILSHLARQSQSLSFERQRLELDDEDFLDIDIHYSTSKNAIILFHGLEGSSESSYIMTFANYLRNYGFDIIAVNYRGCSGMLNRKLQMYHSGFTKDVHNVVSHYTDLYQNLHVIGFSLGGNLVIKYLGENNFDIPANIITAIAISAPMDLESCALELIKPKNRIYERRFMNTLVKKIKQKATLFPHQVNLDNLKHVKNLYDFDDLFTGPIHGFVNAKDYYTQSSSKQFIHNINTPALIISAYDDPFLSVKAIPVQECADHNKVSLVATKFGGHVGFGGYKKGVPWMLEKSLEFISAHS